MVRVLCLLHATMRWTDLGGSGRLAFVVRLRERERELAAMEVLLERRGGVLVFEGRAGIVGFPS
jgi:hypothetical protein